MSGRLVDLDADSRQALEFDEVLEWVASFARTAWGAEQLRALAPLADPGAVREEIDAVSETRRHLEGSGLLIPGRLPDPRQALAALGVSGKALSAPALRALASVTMAGSQLRSVLLELPQREHPRLAALVHRLPDLAAEGRRVLEGIDGEGRILDRASPELRRIRQSKARIGERLKQLLEGILHDPESEPLIRDDFITQRNGRFVIPVRSDAPRPVRGIVHASSSSGQTRFIEPLQSVELNNELVRLAEEEQEEERRVLLSWSDGFRARLDEVHETLATLGRVDALQARGRFGQETGAIEPTVGTGSAIELIEVRHPLLDRLLRGQGSRAVPLRLVLDPPDQVLVLSGPNTGGKTVALKTVGLAVLMAQSGVPVTAGAARLPLYRQVRADIGDHQSIEADLSTYSAHVRAIGGVLRAVAPPALFLFDEIGTGTEPTEGAALAISILESLLVRGVTTVTTTHLAPVKAWSHTTDGAASAAMELDPESFAPTYRVLMGAAGSSAGLEIARRLGLDPAIVDRARERLGGELVQTEQYLERLRETIGALERERERLACRERELVEAQRALGERHEAAERELRREAGAALEAAVTELRRQGRQALEAVREARERARVERTLARAERKVAAEHARLKAELAPSDEEESRSGWVQPTAPLEEGATVWVRSLGREGRFVGARGDRVDVMLGQAVFSVPRVELRVPRGGRREVRRPASASRIHRVPPTAGERQVSSELRLVGKSVDEALGELDKFLDNAVLAGHEEVRIIHGHGTGRLREAVRRFLDGHAQVAAWRAGGPAEGGDGATVVTPR